MRYRGGLILAALLLAATPASTQPRPARDAVPQTARHVPDGFTFAAAGDLLGPYGSSFDPDAGPAAAVAALLRKADVGFANEEGNAFDLKTFAGFTAAENGGGYPLHDPRVLRAIGDMGVTLLSQANNHTTDWGLAGMNATSGLMDELGLTHAGSGASLAQARAAAYRDTPKARVALIAAASTFPGNAPAGNPNRGAGPRPGLNPLHVAPVRLVTPAEFAAIGAIAHREGGGGMSPEAASEATISEVTFAAADRPGLTYRVSENDSTGLAAAVAEARKSADVVAFSIHAHETASGAPDDLEPADFQRALFHRMVDAGADVVMRHGPHSVMGVEIYKGRPIFYGLGHLFFDLPRSITIAGDGPAQRRVDIPLLWYDGAVAISRFGNGKVREVRIYPLLLETADGLSRGLPRLATGADARRILDRIKAGSTRFGTSIAIIGDVGVIRPAS